MSDTHLEEFVMKSNNEAGVELHTADNSSNWRESLHCLVAKCYSSTDYSQVKDKYSNHQKQDRSSSRRVDSVLLQKMDISNVLNLASSIVSEYSPVVSLCDVLKFKHGSEESNDLMSVKQDEFLHYFGLQENNNQMNKNNLNINAKLKGKDSSNKPCYSHPKNLINCPHVPFSSDLGIKLIRERNEIPREIHERKVERLERFLQGIPSVIPNNENNAQYEVIYHKTMNLDVSHFYNFPTKRFHCKDKLTPKARYLLKKYCKPCSVKLREIDIKTVDRSSRRQPAQKLVQIAENNHQKENIQLMKSKGIYLESRVVLTDNFSNYELDSSLKTLPVKGPTENFQTNKSILKTPDNEYSSKTQQQNFSVKTLTQRNENSLETIAENKSTHGIYENFINACVILKPITDFYDMKESNTVPIKSKNKRNGNDKIFKKRVNIHYPRRSSPRLQIGKNKPLIM